MAVNHIYLFHNCMFISKRLIWLIFLKKTPSKLFSLNQYKCIDASVVAQNSTDNIG